MGAVSVQLIDNRVNERDWKLSFSPGDAVFVTPGYVVYNRPYLSAFPISSISGCCAERISKEYCVTRKSVVLAYDKQIGLPIAYYRVILQPVIGTQSQCLFEHFFSSTAFML